MLFYILILIFIFFIVFIFFIFEFFYQYNIINNGCISSISTFNSNNINDMNNSNNSSNSNNSNNSNNSIIRNDIIEYNINDIQISSLDFDMEHYTIGDVFCDHDDYFSSTYSEDEKWNYLFQEYFKIFIKKANWLHKGYYETIFDVPKDFYRYYSSDDFFYEIINCHKSVISSNELEFYCFSILHNRSIEKKDANIFDVKITFVTFSIRKELDTLFNGYNLIFNYSDLILYNEYYTNYLIKEKEFFLNKIKKHLLNHRNFFILNKIKKHL